MPDHGVTAGSAGRSRWRGFLDLSSQLVTLFLGAALAWWFLTKPGPQQPPPLDVKGKAPMDLRGAITDGSPKAPAVMIEYSEFRCPFCRRFATDTLPELRRLYVDSGRLALVFRQLPIHPFASDASAAAICASSQNKFWPVHDVFFQNQLALGEGIDTIRTLALKAGVDPTGFDSCLKDSATAEEVRRDADSAAGLGINGTPAFVFGVRTAEGLVRLQTGFAGARPLGDFKAAIDQALAAVGDGQSAR